MYVSSFARDIFATNVAELCILFVLCVLERVPDRDSAEGTAWVRVGTLDKSLMYNLPTYLPTYLHVSTIAYAGRATLSGDGQTRFKWAGDIERQQVNRIVAFQAFSQHWTFRHKSPIEDAKTFNRVRVTYPQNPLYESTRGCRCKYMCAAFQAS
jgi:hypothetical protein